MVLWMYTILKFIVNTPLNILVHVSDIGMVFSNNGLICFEWLPLVSPKSRVRDEHSLGLNKFIFPGFGQEMLWWQKEAAKEKKLEAENS